MRSRVARSRDSPCHGRRLRRPRSYDPRRRLRRARSLPSTPLRRAPRSETARRRPPRRFWPRLSQPRRRRAACTAVALSARNARRFRIGRKSSPSSRLERRQSPSARQQRRCARTRVSTASPFWHRSSRWLRRSLALRRAQRAARLRPWRRPLHPYGLILRAPPSSSADQRTTRTFSDAAVPATLLHLARGRSVAGAAMLRRPVALPALAHSMGLRQISSLPLITRASARARRMLPGPLCVACGRHLSPPSDASETASAEAARAVVGVRASLHRCVGSVR